MGLDIRSVHQHLGPESPPLLRFSLQANNIKMRKVKLWISVQILAGVWSQASGSPGGAPTSACSTLVPGHGADIQDSTFNPYELTLDVSSVKAGQPVKLTLQASNSSENETLFRGFLIKAKDSLKQPFISY
ncbi:hypothetical protein TCAL_16507 [Tigriopus californicus]|uniref:Reelin domain-containing protein n=1 Tax=Tigriopus californicus TaxID=6832 RepID=A0A553NUI7_TIGCA|nr:hypothetical protein TCAL_16507 [Tigriopus californicus]